MATHTLPPSHPTLLTVRRGFAWGLLAGLVPNGIIFGVLFSIPWFDDHVPDGLALTVLYAGPAFVGLAGLAQMLRTRLRRCGLGLLVAAFATPAAWLLLVYLDSVLSMRANVAGP